MDLSTHTTLVDSEIINENYVAADSEIGNNVGIFSGFTFFLLCV